MTNQYDAIVIGTGQSGPSLAARLAGEGQRVAIVERHLFGGTCVNSGCTPTKALVASARAAHMARRGADFGVEIEGPIRVDMKRVHSRMREIASASTEGVTKWLEGTDNVDVIRGHARLNGPGVVEVDGRALRAEQIFLNVGGRARVPAIEGIEGVDFLTNTSLLDLDVLPEHLVIIGASYIGLEFAQVYRRLGSAVTVIEMGPRAIARDDEDVSETVRDVLEREGVTFRFNAECVKVARSGSGVSVGLSCESGEPEIVGSHLLLAVGRVPNTDDLGLDTVGVATNKRGFIEVDDQLRTSVKGVWALGDCNGRGAFTHTSYHDYEVVAANLLDDDPRRITDRISCYGLFVDPPLGRVGMTEEQARKSGRNVLVGKRMMTNVSRAKERGETDGFIKILVDGDTKEILGAAILGIGGDEVVQMLLTAMYAKAPYTDISRGVYIHPTVSELVPTTLQSLRPLGGR